MHNLFGIKFFSFWGELSKVPDQRHHAFWQLMNSIDKLSQWNTSWKSNKTTIKAKPRLWQLPAVLLILVMLLFSPAYTSLFSNFILLNWVYNHFILQKLCPWTSNLKSYNANSVWCLPSFSVVSSAITWYPNPADSSLCIISVVCL